MIEMTKIFDTEIIHSTIIKAPIEKVYDAISTAEGLDAWFTQGAKVDRKVGGTIYFKWESDRQDVQSGIIEDGGPILEVNRPHSFVFQWSPDSNSYKTTVDIKIKEEERGTVISVREKGFEDTPEGRKSFVGCATGWAEAFTMMKYYLEHGITY
ncbi:MAG: SRPBCC family protein [Candidatus Heimdallarchaeaceae archaeon]